MQTIPWQLIEEKPPPATKSKYLRRMKGFTYRGGGGGVIPMTAKNINFFAIVIHGSLISSHLTRF
jgi:hypothetical protein